MTYPNLTAAQLADYVRLSPPGSPMWRNALRELEKRGAVFVCEDPEGDWIRDQQQAADAR